ncbi:transposase [Rhodococcus sp. NPDC057014]|uniref:IS1634 family transposase n=1 Tax=Rhodococcus sp. NPDC057014 TaxID=3346000 RepID=UPI00363B598E
MCATAPNPSGTRPDTRSHGGRSGSTRNAAPSATTKHSTRKKLGPETSSTAARHRSRHGSSVSTANGRSLDTASIDRARSLIGLKGYVTNLPASIMGPGEVIAKYHDLWQVEQSFRMSKTDLRARPMFHHTRDAIEAHLTVVFTALAVARYLQTETGTSIRSLVRTLRPLQEITMTIAGHPHIAADPLTPDAVRILTTLNLPTR